MFFILCVYSFLLVDWNNNLEYSLRIFIPTFSYVMYIYAHIFIWDYLKVSLCLGDYIAIYVPMIFISQKQLTEVIIYRYMSTFMKLVMERITKNKIIPNKIDYNY